MVYLIAVVIILVLVLLYTSKKEGLSNLIQIRGIPDVHRFYKNKDLMDKIDFVLSGRPQNVPIKSITFKVYTSITKYKFTKKIEFRNSTNKVLLEEDILRFTNTNNIVSAIIDSYGYNIIKRFNINIDFPKAAIAHHEFNIYDLGNNFFTNVSDPLHVTLSNRLKFFYNPAPTGSYKITAINFNYKFDYLPRTLKLSDSLNRQTVATELMKFAKVGNLMDLVLTTYGAIVIQTILDNESKPNSMPLIVFDSSNTKDFVWKV